MKFLFFLICLLLTSISLISANQQNEEVQQNLGQHNHKNIRGRPVPDDVMPRPEGRKRQPGNAKPENLGPHQAAKDPLPEHLPHRGSKREPVDDSLKQARKNSRGRTAPNDVMPRPQGRKRQPSGESAQWSPEDMAKFHQKFGGKGKVTKEEFLSEFPGHTFNDFKKAMKDHKQRPQQIEEPEAKNNGN
mmetsp:Transcript_37523/g.47271  ORF Transcript_37523/g.47271 Transcript_37523/m.47271 type:complete len:189 (-) Transcript_37523:37-603(-)